MDRIEECQRRTGDHFREFLAREDAPALFGSIDLNVRATAVKRPQLAGSPARPREPYGVAELFRECLGEAAEFRGRREQSQRRLRRTVAGAAGLAIAMLALAGGLLATRPAIKTSHRNTFSKPIQNSQF